MKKLLSLVLAIAIIICAVPMGAFTFSVSAATSGYYTYTVSNGEAKITDVSTSISGNVVIPSTLGGYPVTTIESHAFYYCTDLKSVTIPESIECIEGGVFSNCTGLTTVNFNAKNCTYMGDLLYPVFSGCSKLTTINIGNNVTTIPNSAFYDCTGLTSITIPESVESIDAGAFHYCTGLTTVNYNATNCTMNGSSYSSVFNGCKNLKTINIGNKVETIPAYAFYNCTGLTSITIPDNVMYIGTAAFYGCTGLTNAKISNNIKTIDFEVFSNCSSLVNVTLPNKVQSIGSMAFNNCTSLTSIAIPDTVTNIGIASFFNCTSLTSITIPNNIKCIEESAFSNCTGITTVNFNAKNCTMGSSSSPVFDGCAKLTTVNIGNNVEEIPNYAFKNCASITDVYYDGSYAQRFNMYIGYDNSYLTNAEWHYAYSESLAYRFYSDSLTAKVASCDPNATIVDIPSTIVKNGKEYSITSIDYMAFYNCTALTSVTIPDSVISIDYMAFYNCTALTSVTIPDSVTSIGKDAFYNTAYYNDESNWQDDVLYIDNHLIKARTSISGDYTIKSGTLTITGQAFSDCGSLESVIIPDGVVNIGDEAFSNCDSLKSIIIPSSIINIGQFAFLSCDNLSTVNYNATNCKSMYSSYNTTDNHFSYCSVFKDSPITTLNIGENVEWIPRYAFWDCEITSITIPNSVTYIQESAFGACTNLASVTIGENVETIERYAFCGCSNLTTVNFNAIDCSIIDGNGYYPIFDGCPIETINIGDKVKSIPDYVFERCNNLTSVTIPVSVTSIGKYAFPDCAYRGIVYYRGSEEQKSGISIGLGNIYLTNSYWYYNSCIGSVWHTYENNCDADCNVCGETRTPNEHAYDNTCDTTCNDCGSVRTITHTYSNNCDVECNLCGFTRVPSDHIYNNKYDPDCNECGATREVSTRYWKISVDVTGVYNISPTKTISDFNSNSITVFDSQWNEVKYNDTKKGWPLVASLEYTVVLNIDYSNTSDLSWNISKQAVTIFPDTDKNGWYNDSVTYAVGAGIMSGYKNGKFGTSDSIQRQDFLVMLARYEGVNLDEYNYKSKFSDVATGSYYEAAVNWGAEKGIVTGYDNGKFGVGDKVTREQLVTFLYRYAKYKGYDYSYTSNRETVVSDQYKDFKKVSGFATDPILWAIEKGVISGKTNTTIVPQGNAQRCEVAKIMYNIFLNDIFK